MDGSLFARPNPGGSKYSIDTFPILRTTSVSFLNQILESCRLVKPSLIISFLLSSSSISQLEPGGNELDTKLQKYVA